MPGGDMYTALQTGTIDATDWVGPYNDLAFGLHTVAEYYYYPGWQEPGAVMETLVNKEAFEALPDDLQAIIEVATRAINEDMLAEYTARNNAALRELVNKHGVKVRPFPEDVLAKLRDVSNDVLVEMGRDSPHGGAYPCLLYELFRRREGLDGHRRARLPRCSAGDGLKPLGVLGLGPKSPSPASP